ncbi:hypothetical protein CgunFtcFv8_009199 [Champsocephalus gunnari]|uniref:Uncharacterized protein n=1 Tax=Champsocephalus gunnari TaxID=52237 RepID=A0AAN8C2E5_CHAGU|nr:hypothetical protein CgunFtcFv8_009199 [Champsocephalus gunnari]
MLPPQTSSPKKEGPQKKKKKTVGCRKCNLQKVFLFEKIIGRRMNGGKAECEICWLPCSVCIKTKVAHRKICIRYSS